ncbi:MAG: hypothetical protein ACI3YE_04540, partial [Candidatus Avispirillum sp.]
SLAVREGSEGLLTGQQSLRIILSIFLSANSQVCIQKNFSTYFAKILRAKTGKKQSKIAENRSKCVSYFVDGIYGRMRGVLKAKAGRKFLQFLLWDSSPFEKSSLYFYRLIFKSEFPQNHGKRRCQTFSISCFFAVLCFTDTEISVYVKIYCKNLT